MTKKKTCMFYTFNRSTKMFNFVFVYLLTVAVFFHYYVPASRTSSTCY